MFDIIEDLKWVRGEDEINRVWRVVGRDNIKVGI